MRRSKALRRSARVLLRQLFDVLRRRDMPLAAAGLTFYALVALIPLLVVALWLVAVALGADHVRSLAATSASVVGSGHGLDRGLRSLARSATTAHPAAIVTALLISTLYGEGFARSLGRFDPAPQRRRALRGRVGAPLLVAATAILLTGGLLLTRWLAVSLGSGGWWVLLGGYLGFLVCWAGATVNVAICYRVFGDAQLHTPRLWWGAAAAGSWIAGSALGFLYVLSLPISLGSPFAGSDTLGAGALLAFWLYFSHLAVLLGYGIAVQPALRRPTLP